MAKKAITKILILGVTLIMSLGILNGCADTGKVISEEPFYSLQAAYNQELLTKNDLKTIANFHKKGNPESLSAEIESSIKQAYSGLYPQEEWGKAIINEYLGTYGNCVALMISGEHSDFTDALWNETIAGVKIEYNNGQRIWIWKK